VIIGDAAHAMVPFYGQGMNCGFQDIQVLHETLDKHSVGAKVSADGKVSGLHKALDEYSMERSKDAHAICDLAMYNHYEMQSGVTSPLYLARKKLEGTLHRLFPKTIIPLYTMVSFTTIRYSEAIRRWNNQTWWITAAATTTTTVVAATAIGLGLRFYEPLIKSISKYASRT
jgi:kynurenine 3-monooxygenase